MARLQAPTRISHKVFLKSFRKSQFPHKSVHLFLISVIVEDKSFKNTLCETWVPLRRRSSGTIAGAARVASAPIDSTLLRCKGHTQIHRRVLDISNSEDKLTDLRGS